MILDTGSDLLLLGDKRSGDGCNHPGAWPDWLESNVSDRTCSVEGCTKSASTRGWCKMHYTRWARHGDPMSRTKGGVEWTADDDPWNKAFGNRHIVADSGCWVFTGQLNQQGYGVVRFDGRTQYAHRVSFTISKGPIPGDLTVDHICFTKACIRPEHLQLLTLSQNALRQRRRFQPYCANGHERNEENTWTSPNTGLRQCKRCNAERYQRLRAEGRA